MLRYIVRRVLLMIPTVIAISIVTFIIIQLPPGDYLTSLVGNMEAQGITVDAAQLAALRARYVSASRSMSSISSGSAASFGVTSANHSSGTSPSAP